MHYQRYLPPPDLRDHVSHFWVFDDTKGVYTRRRECFLPNGHFELIIDQGAPVRQREVHQPWAVRPTGFLAGAYRRGIYVEPLGKLKSVGVVFMPGAISAFLPNKLAAACRSRTVDLNDLFPRTGNELIENVRDSREDADKILYLQEFLKQHFHSDRSSDPHLQTAIRDILISDGIDPIRRIGDRLSISDRHLRRKFIQHLGLSPKQFAKVIRIYRVVKNQLHRPVTTLTQLAHTAGYFDQAHFIKDFKAMIGVTPSAYFARKDALHRRFV